MVPDPLHKFPVRLFRVKLTQYFFDAVLHSVGGGCAVSLYRFYIFEKEGHIITQPPAIYELPNDAAALQQAKKIIDDRAIEIWRYTSKIGRLNPRRSSKIARNVGAETRA